MVGNREKEIPNGQRGDSDVEPNRKHSTDEIRNKNKTTQRQRERSDVDKCHNIIYSNTKKCDRNK